MSFFKFHNQELLVDIIIYFVLAGNYINFKAHFVKELVLMVGQICFVLRKILKLKQVNDSIE